MGYSSYSMYLIKPMISKSTTQIQNVNFKGSILLKSQKSDLRLFNRGIHAHTQTCPFYLYTYKYTHTYIARICILAFWYIPMINNRVRNLAINCRTRLKESHSKDFLLQLMQRNWKGSWSDEIETWMQGNREVEELRKTIFRKVLSSSACPPKIWRPCSGFITFLTNQLRIIASS